MNDVGAFKCQPACHVKESNTFRSLQRLDQPTGRRNADRIDRRANATGHAKVSSEWTKVTPHFLTVDSKILTSKRREKNTLQAIPNRVPNDFFGPRPGASRWGSGHGSS